LSSLQLSHSPAAPLLATPFAISVCAAGKVGARALGATGRVIVYATSRAFGVLGAQPMCEKI
jgi:hypothetical protein